MSNQINSDVFFILIALIIAALLGFLIGWLMRTVKLNALKKSLDACYKSNEDLKLKFEEEMEQKDFDSQIEVLKKAPIPTPKSETKIDEGIKVASTYNAKPTPAPSLTKPQFNKAEAKDILGKTIKENDLKIVEGIGPKIAEILNNDGITTWEQLGNAPISRLKNILSDAGERFAFHKPDTWPKQSKLAAEYNWNELKKLQDYLDGGKEPSK